MAVLHGQRSGAALHARIITHTVSSPCATACPPSPTQEEHELLGGSADVSEGAARHWRQRKAATGQGAFEGLRVAVAPTLDKPFRRADIV